MRITMSLLLAGLLLVGSVSANDNPRVAKLANQLKCPDGSGHTVAACLVNASCSFAKRVQATLAHLVEEYPDDGVVLRELMAAHLHDHAGADELHGVALNRLNELQRTAFLEAARETPCPGDHTRSLFECRNRSPQCLEGFAALRALLANFNPVAARLLQPVAPRADSKAVAQLLDAREQVELPTNDSPSLGPPDAPVTLVVFADFQCPYSRETASRLKPLLNEYSGKLRLVFKHFPLSFHDRAVPAARVAEAARANGRFWQVHDALFDNQHDLSDATLQRLSGGQTNAASFPNIQRDRQLAESLQLRGTPSCFINGRPLPGLQSSETFRAIIDQELAWHARGQRPTFQINKHRPLD